MHQLLTGDDALRIFQHKLKNARLVAGQLGLPPVQQNRAPAQVQGQAPFRQHRSALGGIGPLQQPADAGQKDLCVIGLGQKIVGSQVHAHQFVQLGGTAGDHKDGQLGLPPQLPADVIAVIPGQIQIQQGQVGPAGQDLSGYILVIVGGGADIAVPLQQRGQLPPQRGVVLHKKNGMGHGIPPCVVIFRKHGAHQRAPGGSAVPSAL